MVSCAERGVPTYFLYTSYILLVPILPMHFSAAHSMHPMQKAVAIFLRRVHRVTPYWEL